MRERRSAIYARASVVFDVTERDPAMVAADIATLVGLSRGESIVVDLEVEKASSRIQIGPGESQKLPEVIRTQWPDAQQVFVACDAGVRPYLAGTLGGLDRALRRPVWFTKSHQARRARASPV
jgi:hypothetical protein